MARARQSLSGNRTIVADRFATEKVDPRCTILRFTGSRLDYNLAVQLQSAMSELARGIESGGHAILDLRPLHYVDSQCLSVLVEAQASLRQGEIEPILLIPGPESHLDELLEVSGLHGVFAVFAKEADALGHRHGALGEHSRVEEGGAVVLAFTGTLAASHASGILELLSRERGNALVVDLAQVFHVAPAILEVFESVARGGAHVALVRSPHRTQFDRLLGALRVFDRREDAMEFVRRCRERPTGEVEIETGHGFTLARIRGNARDVDVEGLLRRLDGLPSPGSMPLVLDLSEAYGETASLVSGLDALLERRRGEIAVVSPLPDDGTTHHLLDRGIPLVETVLRAQAILANPGEAFIMVDFSKGDLPVLQLGGSLVRASLQNRLGRAVRQLVEDHTITDTMDPDCECYHAAKPIGLFDLTHVECLDRCAIDTLLQPFRASDSIAGFVADPFLQRIVAQQAGDTRPVFATNRDELARAFYREVLFLVGEKLWSMYRWQVDLLLSKLGRAFPSWHIYLRIYRNPKALLRRTKMAPVDLVLVDTGRYGELDEDGDLVVETLRSRAAPIPVVRVVGKRASDYTVFGKIEVAVPCEIQEILDRVRDELSIVGTKETQDLVRCAFRADEGHASRAHRELLGEGGLPPASAFSTAVELFRRLGSSHVLFEVLKRGAETLDASCADSEEGDDRRWDWKPDSDTIRFRSRNQAALSDSFAAVFLPGRCPEDAPFLRDVIRRLGNRLRSATSLLDLGEELREIALEDGPSASDRLVPVREGDPYEFSYTRSDRGHEIDLASPVQDSAWLTLVCRSFIAEESENQLSWFEERARAFIQERRPSPDLTLVLREGVTNANVHGNHYNRGKFIRVNLFRIRSSLTVIITDQGEGFPFQSFLSGWRKASGPGHLGIRQMQNFAARHGGSIRFAQGGRRMILTLGAHLPQGD
ncbi:MAG: hypothetical protein HY720_00325 [Planctomycetes bacterium]|nr:hypothetical protein [Planctomycetota bacterium]